MCNLPSTGNDDADNNKRKASSTEVDESEEPTPKCSKKSDIDDASCPRRGCNSGGPPPPVTIVQRVTPISSPNDSNEYRVLRLSSGLTVLLISRQRPTGPSYNDKPAASFTSLLDEAYPGIRMGFQELACFFIPEEKPSHHSIDSIGTTSVGCRRGGSGSSMNFFGGSPGISTTNVAIVVNMGGINDPVACQGLAHFTEHMVHYGSRKFPQEGAVMRTVANFGTFNAFTADHVTAYYNQVPDDLLERNLELFSGMLSEPLFNLDTLGREIQAVNSEFALRLPFWRSLLLMPYVAIKNQDHPMCRFLCGNIKTLSDCKGRNGQRTQGIMKSAHAKNYVASAMTLAINSTKTMEEMEQLTLSYFSNLRQGQHQVLNKMEDKTKSEKIILQNTSCSHYTYLEGNSSMSTLLLTWILPASLWLEKQNSMVVEVILRMLADTSDKSLTARLRKEGLIWDIGLFPNNTHYATTFHIFMALTEAGRERTGSIIQETFAFIHALRDNTSEPEMRRFFEEIRLSNLRRFHYGCQNCCLECTINYATRLQYDGALGNVLNGSSWEGATLDYKSVINGLTLFQQNNLVIIETLPKTVNLNQIKKANENTKAQIKIAPHSGAQYLTVPKNLGFKSGSSISNIKQNPFSLPLKNYYLQEDYQKRSSGNDGAGDNYDVALHTPDNYGDIQPQRLQWQSKQDSTGDDGIRKIVGVHFGHRRVSKDPYLGRVVLVFRSSLLEPTAQTRSIAILWAIIINHKMNSKMSELNMGEYKVYIQPGNLVYIEGFPKHMEQVVGTVMSAMLDGEVTQNDFNMGKTYAKVLWEYAMSSGYPIDYLVQSLTRRLPSMDLAGTIKDLTLDELNCAIYSFRQTAYCIVVLMGNISMQSFGGIATVLDEKDFGPRLNYNPRSFSPQNASPPAVYTPGEKCVRVKILASISVTTTVENVYIIGASDEEDKRTQCFRAAMFFIRCEAFMHLRTTRQLGYVVNARQQQTMGMGVPLLMFSVHVTSTASKFTPCELDREIDSFLAQFGDAVKNLDWELFNRMKIEAGVPDSLTKTEVGNWFNTTFDKNFGTQDVRTRCAIKGIRKVSVQALSGSPEANQKPCSCEKCSNIAEWMRGGGHNSELQFAVGNGDYKNYFIY